MRSCCGVQCGSHEYHSATPVTLHGLGEYLRRSNFAELLPAWRKKSIGIHIV